MLERDESKYVPPLCAICGRVSEWAIWDVRLCGTCASEHHEEPRFTTASVLKAVPDTHEEVCAEFAKRTAAWVAERRKARSHLALVEVRR